MPKKGKRTEERARKPESAREREAAEAPRAGEARVEEGVRKRSRKAGAALGTVFLATAVCAACAIYTAGMSAVAPMQPQAQEPAPTERAQPAGQSEQPCAHDWAPLYDKVHHEAVTETVEHPEEREARTVYHTVCNECEKAIDGRAEAHIEATGHSGYTTGVPRRETVKVRDAWTETVTKEQAYDEDVLRGSICLSCGEVDRAHGGGGE